MVDKSNLRARALVLRDILRKPPVADNVPAGSESHFKVVMVSETFEAMPLIARHRQVNRILSHELANDIHALAIHTYTAREWRKKNGEAPMSPPCLGGST